MSAVIPADRVPGPETGPRFNPLAWRNERRAAAREHVAQVRGDPGDRRELLRAAHAERTAAEAEVARLRDTLDRARAHFAETSVRQAKVEAAGLAADAADETALVHALMSGAAAPVAEPASSAPAARELTIAEAAVARIAADLQHAEQRFAEARQGVSEAAWALLEDHAAGRAAQMLAEQEAMRARRAELRQIWDALHGATAKLFGEPVDLDPAIFKAVLAEDPPPVWKSSYPGFAPPEPPNPWAEVLAELAADPEAPIPG